MNKRYIIYNPAAGNQTCMDEVEILEIVYDNTIAIDINKISNYRVFLSGLDKTDTLILCGGDGTLNRFVNDTRGIEIHNDLYFYAVGCGNDFVKDLGREKGDEPDFKINQYIRHLPRVTVNGKEKLFVNNVSFGISCSCYERRRERILSGKKDGRLRNIGTAISELLSRKPMDAEITVDGQQHHLTKVWQISVMNGRYECGGMLSAPDRNRLEEKEEPSVMLLHGVGKLGALKGYLSMCRGKHPKTRKGMEIWKGSDIRIKPEVPVFLQMDGDMAADVTEYHIVSAAL